MYNVEKDAEIINFDFVCDCTLIVVIYLFQ